MICKADLHIHSKFSDRPPEWLLRKINFPDSRTEPSVIYDTLKGMGMDFVTITDHNTIEGCLEIAEHEDVFISEEVTTRFPEDRCEVHLLVWGINETQHADIAQIRDNIYELQSYLSEHGIAHGVAHPLRSYDKRFGPSHLERLLLLFNHFETINGLCDSLYGDVMSAIIGQLNEDRIHLLEERHQREATIVEPWVKFPFGGSNDHAGLKMGSGFTQTPWANGTDAFVRQIRLGHTEAAGENGNPVSASHSLYKTAYYYLRDHVIGQTGPAAQVVEKVFSRFLEGENPTTLSFSDKLQLVAETVKSGKILEFAKPGSASLTRETAQLISSSQFQRRIEQLLASGLPQERRAFGMANLLADTLAFRFFERVAGHIGKGNLIAALEEIGSVTPLALGLAPYFYSFQNHTAMQDKLGSLSLGAVGSSPRVLRNDRRAWFTDTLYDVNGVSTTIKKMASEAVNLGKELTIITCSDEAVDLSLPIKNFAPIGAFELPEYELQKLFFPPVLQILDYLQTNRCTEVILSTPGPVGLAGMLAGKLLGTRITTIYHTDFPQYVNILTEDSFLEHGTWKFMQWFYDRCDLVYVNSQHYRNVWVDRGMSESKLATLPRGLDTDLFHPSRRDRRWLESFGIEDENLPVLFYAGRVSKEKDLDLLVGVDAILKKKGLPYRFVIVGDGPYKKELSRLLKDAIFPGYMAGEELACAYASGDIFVFPSTTDTYGNVVVEAMASGIPAIVSDQGGPKDLVEDGVTGYVTRSRDAADFAEKLAELIESPEMRLKMQKAARLSVQDRSWANALETFWERSASV